MAIERANVLIGSYRNGKVANPDIYIPAVIAVLARYPESVVLAVTEPATGIPSKLKWMPEIAEVVEACEAEMEPLLRRYERERVEAERRRALPAPPRGPKLTMEELEAKLGRPLRTCLKSMEAAPVPGAPDGRHVRRALADLAARRLRAELKTGE